MVENNASALRKLSFLAYLFLAYLFLATIPKWLGLASVEVATFGIHHGAAFAAVTGP